MKCVIFRPTNNCNLACTYCYDKNNHNETIANIRKDATILFENNFDKLLNHFNILFEDELHPRVIYHGGEPLLIKTSTLDKFCLELKKIKDVDFSIQTNGTLIDNEVIDLFKKYNFKVGVSLDGCNEKENAARIYINKTNSFNTVYSKLKMMQLEKIKFGIIMSINKNHINSAEKMYDFIAQNNFHCNIRPVFATEETIDDVMTNDEYVEFFNELFDIWYDDKDRKVATHQILELYNSLKEALIYDYKSYCCSDSNDCFKNFISIDVNGELYACNRLYGIEKFHYGNLDNMTINDVLNKSEELLKTRNDAINNKCSGCNSLNKCYGGCPAESYDIYGDILHETNYCKIKKKINSHVKERLNE